MEIQESKEDINTRHLPNATLSTHAARPLIWILKCAFLLVPSATVCSSDDLRLYQGDLEFGHNRMNSFHLVSYLDSFLSSQAVFPPPKFCFAVLSKP